MQNIFSVLQKLRRYKHCKVFQMCKKISNPGRAKPHISILRSLVIKVKELRGHGLYVTIPSGQRPCPNLVFEISLYFPKFKNGRIPRKEQKSICQQTKRVSANLGSQLSGLYIVFSIIVRQRDQASCRIHTQDIDRQTSCYFYKVNRYSITYYVYFFSICIKQFAGF